MEKESIKVSKKKIQIAEPLTGVDEWRATKEVFLSGWLTQGKKVNEFENAFAKYHNVKHAIAVSSCTTGLHLVLAASGINLGDEVIVPSFTWVSTANAVLYCGAKPILVDVDIKTNNINMDSILSKITKKTKAIIVVHLFGLCVDVDELRKKIDKKILIFEDCACAAGAKIKNKYAGSLGKAGVFSFHPRKAITTGEGGMITTNDSKFAEKINILRNHGASISEEQRHNGPQPHILPDFNILGYNYRMTDIQGSVGLVQLKKLNKILEYRNRWANYYLEKLANIGWIMLPLYNKKDFVHGWQSFIIHINQNKSPLSRNNLMQYLFSNGVSTRPGTHAIHMLSYYKKKYRYKANDYPNAKKCNNDAMALPLHNKMVKSDYDKIINLINNL